MFASNLSAGAIIALEGAVLVLQAASSNVPNMQSAGIEGMGKKRIGNTFDGMFGRAEIQLPEDKVMAVMRQ